MSGNDKGSIGGDRSKAEVLKQSQDKRLEIRGHIRERDTIQRKWLALAENIKAEDNRRDQFYRRKHVEDTKSIPINVVKFIGSLKKAVRKIMRYKGGTPYSIVRSLFIYWDAAKTGTINAEELMQVRAAPLPFLTSTSSALPLLSSVVHEVSGCQGRSGGVRGDRPLLQSPEAVGGGDGLPRATARPAERRAVGHRLRLAGGGRAAGQGGNSLRGGVGQLQGDAGGRQEIPRGGSLVPGETHAG